MRAGAVVGLVACLALSGCATSSPKPAPRAAPTPSTPSATSSATARPTVPAIPAPAPTPATIPTAGRPATARSAAAFVTFFFTQLNVAFQSGDAHVVEQLSDPECGVCNTYVTALMKDKAAGKHIVGESFAAISAEAAHPEGNIAYVTVRNHSSSTTCSWRQSNQPSQHRCFSSDCCCASEERWLGRSRDSVRFMKRLVLVEVLAIVGVVTLGLPAGVQTEIRQ